MNQLATSFEGINESTLLLIPCCKKKVAGGLPQISAEDPLEQVVSVYSTEELHRARHRLIDELLQNGEGNVDPASKLTEVCMGKEFGRHERNGKYRAAIDRYAGGLYSASKNFSHLVASHTNNSGQPHLLILSALYGPLHPLSPIQDYNVKMSDSHAFRAWRESFGSFLASYVKANGIQDVRMFFGTSTAYLKVCLQAVNPLLRSGDLEQAFQYHVVNGNAYHTPHNHGLLVAAALRSGPRKRSQSSCLN